MDWAVIFDPTTPILETIFRGTIIYLGIIVFLRLVGTRETGSISVTDLVVVLLISEAVATALNAEDTTITSGFVLVATVLGWSFILDALAYRFPWFRKLLKPVKMPLIKDDVLAMVGCSQNTVARARRILNEHNVTTATQVETLIPEGIDRLFSDGRKTVTGEFVPINIEKVIAARVGRKKPPLKVLWAKYVQTDAPAGMRHYSYDRFCELVAEHVRVNDLTAPITHAPGHTMQVDWAGTRMQIIDPISRATTPVSVFVASLPYSGLVFAYGYLDEKQPAWHDAHRRAFDYIHGVTLLVVPTTLRRHRTRSVRPRVLVT